MNQRLDKIISVILISILIMCNLCVAEQNSPKDTKPSSELLNIIADMEIEDDRNALSLWTNSETIKALSDTVITDDYVKSLYGEFKSVVVTPPNPNTYEIYGIENAEDALEKVSYLGPHIHNLGLAMSGKDFEKYGTLIQCMRDVLYVDFKHIPLAIRHDNSRDVYWYSLHNKLVEKTVNQYNNLFNDDE